jgi:hypothetical protein
MVDSGYGHSLEGRLLARRRRDFHGDSLPVLVTMPVLQLVSQITRLHLADHNPRRV